MRKALLVGINNYPSSPLLGCINDAKELGTVLEKNGDGSPNFDVRIHADVPTKAALTELVYDVFTGENEISLLYFSGHGVTDAVDTYLVTPDARRFDPGVSVNSLLKMANNGASRNRIVILDCCNSGQAGSSNVIGSNIAVIGKGVTIMTASKHDEPAMEKNGHGVFTNLLIQALKGGAADAHGEISIGRVYAYIDQALGPHHQRPLFKTNITGFIALRRIVPPVPAEVIRRIVTYFPDPQIPFALNPSFEESNIEEAKKLIGEPYADPKNVAVFKDLQQLQSIGLLKPKDERYMYYAAMHSKSCELTPLGLHYWRLVNENKF